MKILLLTHEYPPYPGGVGRYCASMAAAAARAGHQVTVLAPDHAQVTSGCQTTIREVRFKGDVFHMRELSALRRQVHNAVMAEPGGYDIVHAADWPMILAIKGLNLGKARCLATLHGSDVMLLSQSWRARLNGSRSALTRFESLLCNSAYTKELLAKFFPALFESAAITPLGVDEHWFDPAQPASIQDYLKRIAARQGDLVVLTVARLDSRKGQLTTINALGKLPLGLKERIHYVCVGKEVEAGYAQKLEQAAQAQNIRLTLTGRLPDGELQAAYGTAHIFALTGIEAPGKVEGFGLVLLEAAAQGLPAIVTRLQAMPEVVKHGTTGWVADQAELVGAFQQALNQADQKKLQAACIAHARTYTWDRCMSLSYAGTDVSSTKVR
jgi:phosphatidyl-myo-inositol dimannoside synthase